MSVPLEGFADVEKRMSQAIKGPLSWTSLLESELPMSHKTKQFCLML